MQQNHFIKVRESLYGYGNSGGVGQRSAGSDDCDQAGFGKPSSDDKRRAGASSTTGDADEGKRRKADAQQAASFDT